MNGQDEWTYDINELAAILWFQNWFYFVKTSTGSHFCQLHPTSHDKNRLVSKPVTSDAPSWLQTVGCDK